MLSKAQVEAKIIGIKLVDVYKIPREALFDSKFCFVVNSESKLETKELNIVWRDAGNIYARADLNENHKIVISKMLTPVDGAMVKVR